MGSSVTRLTKSVLCLALVFVCAPCFAEAATSRATYDKIAPPPRAASQPLPAPLPPSEPIPQAAPEEASTKAAAFFPILPNDAPPETEPSFLPVASNHGLDADHQGITRGVIVVHDFSRDANKALAIISTLAGAENSNSMILAPQFLLDSDITRFANSLPEKGRAFARWPLGGWETGADSLAPAPQKGISSFTVIDLLLMYFSDRSLFPDLKEIVIAGHGNGADFIQRYAAVGQAPDVVGRQGIPMHFLVADASSYLYISILRPRSGRQGFSPPDTNACKDFNSWPYGTGVLNAYAKRIGVNAIKTGFGTRHISYIVGENASKTDPSPDTGCAATMQGADRPTRGINYATYIGLLYGETTSKKQDITILPDTGYDAAAIYGSTCGMSVLFGDGDCTPPLLKPAGAP